MLNRRQAEEILLHYFGEEFDGVNGPGAMNCDNLAKSSHLGGSSKGSSSVAVPCWNIKWHRMGFYTSLLTATAANGRLGWWGCVLGSWKHHDIEFWQGIRQTVS